MTPGISPCLRSGRLERRAYRRYRRQGPEGSHLPPAPLQRVGATPGWWHRRKPPTHARGHPGTVASPSNWPPVATMKCTWRKRVSPPTRCRRRGLAQAGWRDLRFGRTAVAQGRQPLLPVRPQRPAPSTWACCWPRCSSCQGRTPMQPGELIAGDRGARAPRGDDLAGLGGTGQSWTRKCPWSAWSTWASCATSAGAPGCTGRHADLLRLPCHRGDRRGYPPGAGAGRLPRAAARAPADPGLEHRLDQRTGPRAPARLRHRPATGQHQQTQPARRGAAGVLPAVRKRPYRIAQPVRFHGCRRFTAAASAWSRSTISNAFEPWRTP